MSLQALCELRLARLPAASFTELATKQPKTALHVALGLLGLLARRRRPGPSAAERAQPGPASREIGTSCRVDALVPREVALATERARL
jgi:hypothetical protein